MQALCPQCSQKIVIDDAKVPDRPFSVKCPRCQNVLKLPGKAVAAEAPPPAAPAAAPEAGATSEQTRAPSLPPMAGGLAIGGGGPLPGDRALVALTDRALAAFLSSSLARLGYPVDSANEGSDAGRLLEQGVYSLVATTRGFSAPGQAETLHQRIARLSPDNRRRVLAILVGDEFKTGDGTQAFVLLVDLVLNSRDAPAADNFIRGTVAERRRIYQVFNEARARFEASAAV